LVIELLDPHPDTELEAPTGEMVHRGSGFSEGTWKMQDRIRNERPDPNRVGPQCHRSDDGQTIEPRDRGIAGVSRVIRCEEEIKAKPLDMSPALKQCWERRIRKDQDAESQHHSVGGWGAHWRRDPSPGDR
jgi:hypothetical protein